jgi:hypothetical protein
MIVLYQEVFLKSTPIVLKKNKKILNKFRKKICENIFIKKKDCKMDTKQLVERIKKQLSNLINGEMKFAQIQAGEMTITTPDEEFTIGSEVYSMDKDGNNIPLTDGEYKADDGTMMMVVGGKITEIKKEMETENPEVEVSIESQTQEMASEDSNYGKCNCEERMGKMEVMLGDLMKKFEDMKMEKEQMMEKFSKIAEQPSSTKIEPKEAGFSEFETKKSNSGAPDIIAIREQIRKNR